MGLQTENTFQKVAFPFRWFRLKRPATATEPVGCGLSARYPSARAARISQLNHSKDDVVWCIDAPVHRCLTLLPNALTYQYSALPPVTTLYPTGIAPRLLISSDTISAFASAPYYSYVAFVFAQRVKLAQLMRSILAIRHIYRALYRLVPVADARCSRAAVSVSSQLPADANATHARPVLLSTPHFRSRSASTHRPTPIPRPTAWAACILLVSATCTAYSWRTQAYCLHAHSSPPVPQAASPHRIFFWNTAFASALCLRLPSRRSSCHSRRREI